MHQRLCGAGGDRDQTYDGAWLQNLVDLTINTFANWGMTRRLDRVNGIEDILAKLIGHVHEVTFFEGEFLRETSGGRVLGGPIDLENVVVDTDDVGISEDGNLASRSADSSPDVQNLHVGLDTNLGSEVVLMSSNRLHEWFTLVKATKMEVLRFLSDPNGSQPISQSTTFTSHGPPGQESSPAPSRIQIGQSPRRSSR